MFVKVERNMTNVKLIIYLCWAAAVCMENAIDPHHQCCCFKCNLEHTEQHTEQQGTQMFYLFVPLSQLFYVLDESEMWKQNSISPEWWKMFWYGEGWRASRSEWKTTFDEIFTEEENLFYAFTAAQINLEVGWLFVNNKSRHNPPFVVKDLSFRYCFVSFTPALCCSHIELSAPRRRLSSWKSFSSSIHHSHGKLYIFPFISSSSSGLRWWERSMWMENPKNPLKLSSHCSMKWLLFLLSGAQLLDSFA